MTCSGFLAIGVENSSTVPQIWKEHLIEMTKEVEVGY
jgi:hypothetical protein